MSILYCMRVDDSQKINEGMCACECDRETKYGNTLFGTSVSRYINRTV